MTSHPWIINDELNKLDKNCTFGYHNDVRCYRISQNGDRHHLDYFFQDVSSSTSPTFRRETKSSKVESEEWFMYMYYPY